MHCVIDLVFTWYPLSQVKLSRYAFEDVLRAVLKREFPIYSPENLSSWYAAGGQLRWKVLRYFLQRASLNLQILSRMQLITRTRCDLLIVSI